MRRILFALLLALAIPVAALAVGPIYSPATCKLTWTAPTKNADGTPLTDLAAFRMYIGTAPGVYPPTPTGVIAATNPAPVPGTNYSWSCIGLSDGQKYANVKGVDIAGNEAAPSNEFPFVFDGVKPGGVMDLTGAP